MCDLKRSALAVPLGRSSGVVLGPVSEVGRVVAEICVLGI